MGCYLETFLDQLPEKANVIVQTDAEPEAEHNVLGNHWAAMWLRTLASKFTVGVFRIKEVTWVVNGGEWNWVVTLDRPRDFITDMLSSESNCLVQGLDF